MFWPENRQLSCCLFVIVLAASTSHSSLAEESKPRLWDRVSSATKLVGHHDSGPNHPENCQPRRHFAHFGPPTRSYSAFESPTSYGTHPNERCRPDVFSPRGIGVARRSGCERMDYSPYVLSTTHSNHGPSYYTRHELAPCHHPHCHHGQCNN